MPGINPLQLELEISKMARAMMTRNSQIGKDLIGHLKSQITIEAVASLMLASIERLIWFDIEAVFWTIENLIPPDVMQEIRNITGVAVYKRLIGAGFIPGADFSADGEGKLLLSDKAKTAVLSVNALNGYEIVGTTLLPWQRE